MLPQDRNAADAENKGRDIAKAFTSSLQLRKAMGAPLIEHHPHLGQQADLKIFVSRT